MAAEDRDAKYGLAVQVSEFQQLFSRRARFADERAGNGLGQRGNEAIYGPQRRRTNNNRLAKVLAGGMPLCKYLSNRFLTAVENFALGQNLGDFHSGFRVYRREVLARIPFERNSDDFVFDTQLLVQAIRLGVCEVIG
jgi:hypothetical protein